MDVFIIKVFQDLVQKEKQIGGDQIEELVISTKYIVSNYYKPTFYLSGKLNLGAWENPKVQQWKKESCADS